MTDSPLYDATLSDLLLQARRSAVRAEERAAAQAALAARRVAEEAERVRQAAAIEVLKAQRLAVEHAAKAEREAQAKVEAVRREAAQAAREERVRQALIAQAAEDRVRQALADVPPLPALAGRTAAVDGPAEEVEPEAPPVPSMEELLRPTPGVTRFLDALLGPPEP